MKIILRALLIVLALVGCQRNPSGGSAMGGDSTAKQKLLQTDISFSNLSKTNGEQYAFMEYMADKGVLLRPNHDPMKESMVRLFIQMLDTSKSSLTWQPTDADVSSSGELGYTYGVYTYREPDTTMRGTYISVWKKDSSGNWKVVLDSGNSGLAKTK